MTKFLHLPRFIEPPDLKERLAFEHTHPHPLSFCSACRYVLCSCGNCHSEECLQPCLYESDPSGMLLQTEENTEASARLQDLLNNRLEDE